MPPENRLDLWDVNTRLKSIPWIPNETRVSFRNETPVSIGIVIFVNKNNLCFFLIFGVSSIYCFINKDYCEVSVVGFISLGLVNFLFSIISRGTIIYAII